MPACVPRIIGPVTSWSRAPLVEGALPAGPRWGVQVSMLLAAAKAEGPNKAILAKGYKAEDKDTTAGLQPDWREPAQWNQVLNADAAFT